MFAGLVIITLYRKVNIRCTFAQYLLEIKADKIVNYLPYPSIFAEFWGRFLTKQFLIALGVYTLSSFLFFFSYKFQISNVGITTPNLCVLFFPIAAGALLTS